MKKMSVMERADPDRIALHAVIAFPYEGYYYVIQDAPQLKDVIERLDKIYQQLTGKGQTKTVSMTGVPSLDGTE